MAIIVRLRFPAMVFLFHIPARFINSTLSRDLLFGTTQAYAKEAGAKPHPMPMESCMLETLTKWAGRYLTPLSEQRSALSLQHRFRHSRRKLASSRMQAPYMRSI